MSIIPEKMVRMVIRQACTLVAGFVLAVTSFSHAQGDYTSNGYIFMHPYFNKTNWQAALFSSSVDVHENIHTTKPVSFAMSGAAAQGTVVYTTTAKKWFVTNAPLVNDNSICGKPTIAFEEPMELAISTVPGPDPAIQHHVVCRSAAFTDSLFLIAASPKKIFSITFRALTGTIGTIDSTDIGLTADQKIVGVSGEPNGSGIDTAVWIYGSNGLIVQLPFGNNGFGTVRKFSIPSTETVLCVGEGYAGTVSGKLYRRNGTAFTVDASLASSAIHYVSAHLAVGDGGTVLVKKDNAWQSFSSGSSNYRYANLTATATGSAVELIDNSWNYTLRAQLFDTPTSIGSVLPTAAAVGLAGGCYAFSNISLSTITINLHDPDKNNLFPTVRLSGETKKIIIDSTVVLRRNPAALCSSSVTRFNDSIVKLILEPGKVTIEASVVKGTRTTSCSFWKWQATVSKTTTPWTNSDTLHLTIGNDTFKIDNATSSVKTIVTSPHTMLRTLLLCTETGIMIGKLNVSDRVVGISCIDPTGRELWQKNLPNEYSGIRVQQFSRGIYLFKIHYSNGTSEVKRLIIAR